MKTVELPRPLEDYFAFAELEPHGDARRFAITLPYLVDTRLDRLQWWWRMSAGEQVLLGEEGLAARRAREIERFKRHICRWLENTGQRLEGEGPIPRIVPRPDAEPQAPPEQPAIESLATLPQRAVG